MPYIVVSQTREEWQKGEFRTSHVYQKIESINRAYSHPLCKFWVRCVVFAPTAKELNGAVKETLRQLRKQ